MDKSFGEKKFQYYLKNKRVKSSFMDSHSLPDSVHKQMRIYVKSYLNSILKDRDMLDDFYFPVKSVPMVTHWDCKPGKPSINKLSSKYVN